MTAFYDLDVERELLGSLVLDPKCIDDVTAIVTADDLFSPVHQAAFTTIVAMYRRGDDPTDLRRLVADLHDQGTMIDPAEVVTWPGTFRWRSAAERVAELRLRRSLAMVASVATDAAEGVPDIDAVRAALDAVVPANRDVPDTLEVSADLAESEIELAPWVVPGLLRREDRAIIVGFEGDGKSTLLAQVSWCAASGLHPFTRRPAPPCAVLYIDLENRRHRIQQGYRPLVDLCKQQGQFDRSRHFTWRRSNGIDIRGRRDQAELEAILRQLRPDLVCLGPLRKSYRRKAGENDEASSLDVQWHFDQLVDRYGFALLIEHHAPHGDGVQRKARPFGSSTWLGWSEFGYGMTPEVKDGRKTGRYTLDGFREDRTTAEWPDELHRGQTWPWDGLRGDGWADWSRDAA